MKLKQNWTCRGQFSSLSFGTKIFKTGHSDPLLNSGNTWWWWCQNASYKAKNDVYMPKEAKNWDDFQYFVSYDKAKQILSKQYTCWTAISSFVLNFKMFFRRVCTKRRIWSFNFLFRIISILFAPKFFELEHDQSVLSVH